MDTKMIRVEDTERIRDEELAEAARILQNGGLVAFPTETVYGRAIMNRLMKAAGYRRIQV